MGINYSLCIVAKRDQTTGLLASLAEHLSACSRARLPNGGWKPETEVRRTTRIGTTEVDARGIAGVLPEEREVCNHYCLSFEVHLEREVEAYVPDHRFRCFERPDSFGCMWTSVFAGDEFVLLEMTAATSRMSRVIQHSETIHKMWIDIARRSHSIFAYIDIEERDAIQLFPAVGHLWLPDIETLAFENDWRFSVDRFVMFLMDSSTE